MLTRVVLVLRNPFLFIFLLMLAGGTYVAYTLNLLGPMMQMSNAAVNQGVEIAKQQLRDFIANSEAARSALNVPSAPAYSERESISMDTLDGQGRKASPSEEVDDI